jgi:hypothetical protein
MGHRACEARGMFVAAVVLALALLVVAVSWGREIDGTAHGTDDPDRVSGSRAA